MPKINMDKNALFEESDSLKQLIRSAETDKEKLHIEEYFRNFLTYTSNALGGNTLSESDTKEILTDGLAIGGKTVEEHNEVTGHMRAYNYMLECAKEKPLKLSEELICHMHLLYYAGVDIENAGTYKKVQNYIAGSEYTPPSPKVTPTLMKTFINDMNSQHQVYHPIEYSAILHKRLYDIHPFVGGNGRIARLLTNMITMNSGYGLCVIPLTMKDEYSEALNTAIVKNDANHFVCLIATCVVETQKNFCRKLGISANA